MTGSPSAAGGPHRVRLGRIRPGRPGWFAGGTAAIAAGVLLHLPDFLATAGRGYAMAGMRMSGVMATGMVLVVAGLVVAVWGLLPPPGTRTGSGPVAGSIGPMDRAPLRPAHRKLIVVLGLAITIDTMKPATLGFVLPGLVAEYEVSIRYAAALPFVALTGTTVGSVAWGLLADRVGRRAAILLSGLLFMATSVCGFMPEFRWNLVMCFLMGAAAGGMLPIAYALSAESMPANRRGVVVVTQTGLGTVGGYLAASGAAAVLEPAFGWRVLWVVGLPSGLLLLLLNRWIPESPRFLLAAGRPEEAYAVMARYGVTTRPAAGPDRGPPAGAELDRPGLRLVRLFRRPYGGHTATIVGYALAWGLVNWGFITFLPTFLRHQGSGGSGDLLFLAALLAVPNTFLVAYLYGRWSSTGTMAGYAGLAVLALLGFALVPPAVLRHDAVVIGLAGLLLVGTGGMVATLAPYTTELYPTSLRASGSGLAAAASKLGGVVGPPLVGTLATAASLRMVALLVAFPVGAVTVAVHRYGRQTSGRPLPEEPEPGPGRPDRSRG